MSSLPQETIDEIIDNLPRSSLRSSSLVAKRWRRRSQQGAFASITFSSESKASGWYEHTHNDPGGIASYVKLAKFCGIAKWADSGLLGRVLRNFTSLKSLWVEKTALPDRILECVSHEKPGKSVIGLRLGYPKCSLATLISTITAFPNLQLLRIDYFKTRSTEAPPAHLVSSQKLLDHLWVDGCEDGVTQALESLGFRASRCLTLGLQAKRVGTLLSLSSETVVNLTLVGMCLLHEDRKDVSDSFTDHPDWLACRHSDLSPLRFPFLTSLNIYIFGPTPSFDLHRTLHFIFSAPALASVVLRCEWPVPKFKSFPKHPWGNLDGWLVGMARKSSCEGRLVLTLKRWHEDGVPQLLFSRFKRVGKITTIPPDSGTSC